MAFIVCNQSDSYGVAACHDYSLYRRAMARLNLELETRNFEH